MAEKAEGKKEFEKQQELIEKKEVAFYSEAVRAWYQTSMEHDKSLLTLSAGGIGLLLTLLTKFNAPTCLVRLLYIVALLAFLVCCIVVLQIFKRNRKHLEDVVASSTTNDPVLAKLDSAATWAFRLGVVFSSLIGISAAFNSTGGAINNSSTKLMEEAMVTGKRPEDARPDGSKEKASLEGVNKLRPSTPQKTPEQNQKKESNNTGKRS